MVEHPYGLVAISTRPHTATHMFKLESLNLWGQVKESADSTQQRSKYLDHQRSQRIPYSNVLNISYSRREVGLFWYRCVVVDLKIDILEQCMIRNATKS